MSKLLQWTIAILLAGILGILYYSSESNRYQLTLGGEGKHGFKIDKRTGQVWMVYVTSQKLIPSEEPNLPKKEQAIELAKNATLMHEYLTNGSQIKAILKDKKGELNIYGWNAIEYEPNVFFVNYSWDEGNGIVGYSFEVNTVADIVRNIRTDPELTKKYYNR